MTMADWKNREAEQDFVEMCEQERLRKALMIEATQTAGWELFLGLGKIFAVLALTALFILAVRKTAKAADQASVMAPAPYDETGVMDR